MEVGGAGTGCGSHQADCSAVHGTYTLHAVHGQDRIHCLVSDPEGFLFVDVLWHGNADLNLIGGHLGNHYQTHAEHSPDRKCQKAYRNGQGNDLKA